MSTDHFGRDHFLCAHQGCLDKHFIVFSTEAELKQHSAREHGNNMSRAEKRQALSIPVNFQVHGIAYGIASLCAIGMWLQ